VGWFQLMSAAKSGFAPLSGRAPMLLTGLHQAVLEAEPRILLLRALYGSAPAPYELLQIPPARVAEDARGGLGAAELSALGVGQH
jgi:hypothetical protein